MSAIKYDSYLRSSGFRHRRDEHRSLDENIRYSVSYPKDRKCVGFVGDWGSGRNTLSLRMANIEIEGPKQKYRTSNIFQVDLQKFPVLQETRKMELLIRSIPGNVDYLDKEAEFFKTRQAGFQDFNVFAFCFALNNRCSFRNVIDKWIPEAMNCLRGEFPAFILVGMKSDLRTYPERNPSLIDREEGENARIEVGACGYYECAAKYDEGVDSILIAILKLLLQSD
ncbi:uncharacterized protein NPIL_577921 [Nephila pilipes]|uniref:Uncharacterized protein n=1 Tax=Nephila pilipes TaxID=299642 RepID=A0A8X6P9T0_NEPPI|nr:uncharacterized protein NPIL_577921 [Nephila pilipes]